jgi:hypothetical protein
MSDSTTPIPMSVDAARQAMLTDAAREAEAAGWKIIQLATLLRAAAADLDGSDQ